MESEDGESGSVIKPCTVILERCDIMTDVMDVNSDSPDLPFLFSTNKTKKKSKKSSAELLMEHQNLCQNLKVDTVSLTQLEEVIRKIETEEVVNTNEDSSTNPPSENNDIHVFCVKDCLQYFNFKDITYTTCGKSKKQRKSITTYEKNLTSIKRAELEHAISSALFSANTKTISNIKLFLKYLLRTLSLHQDKTSISACYDILKSLAKHPKCAKITFSSAEIFMLLFNYGVDIDNFKFFSQWTDLKNSLEVPQNQSKVANKIPEKWIINFEFLLLSLRTLAHIFKKTDIHQIIIFFMYISSDSTIKVKNMISKLQDCIVACLEQVKEDEWNETLYNILSALTAVEYFSEVERWGFIYEMMESFSSESQRACCVSKAISYCAIKCLVNDTSEIDHTYMRFQLSELQDLLRQLSKCKLERLKCAAKFVDGCVRNLDASKEELFELSNTLKQCGTYFSEDAQNEKTLFMKIYAKLRIFCGQKVFFCEDKFLNWSSEVKCQLNLDKNNWILMDEICVKEEATDHDNYNLPTFADEKIVDIKKNLHPFIYENNVNETLVEDISDLPKISQVKSIAQDSKDVLDNSVFPAKKHSLSATPVPSISVNYKVCKTSNDKKIIFENLEIDAKNSDVLFLENVATINKNIYNFSSKPALNSEDLEIIELYTDPKRYGDKECLIIHESEDVVVLDSD